MALDSCLAALGSGFLAIGSLGIGSRLSSLGSCLSALCSWLVAVASLILALGSRLQAPGSLDRGSLLSAVGFWLDTDFCIPVHVVYIVIPLSIFLKVAAQRNTYILQTKFQLRRGSYLLCIELPLSVSICRRRPRVLKST